MIVTSNKPFSRWGEIFGDDMAATAMVDRLIHHAEILSLKAIPTGSRTATSDPHRPPERRNRLTNHPSATSPRAAERLTTRRSTTRPHPKTSESHSAPIVADYAARRDRLSVFASPRRRDPARRQKRTLFLVEDQVSNIRQTARVPHATWLPTDVTVKHRGISLAVFVHEHELLAEPVLEIPQIAPRPFLDRQRRRMTIAHAQKFIPVHANDHNQRHGGTQDPSRETAKAPIAAQASPLGARPSRRRAL